MNIDENADLSGFSIEALVDAMTIVNMSKIVEEADKKKLRDVIHWELTSRDPELLVNFILDEMI